MIRLLAALLLTGQQPFNPSDLGIGNPMRDRGNTNTKIAARVGPRKVKKNKRHAVAGPPPAKRVPYTARVWLRTPKAVIGPKPPLLHWELYVEAKETPKSQTTTAFSKAAGDITLPRDGFVEIPVYTAKAFIQWKIGEGSSPEWELDHDVEYTELPLKITAGDLKGGVLDIREPIEVFRNVIDVQIAGLPADAKVKLGDTVLQPLTREGATTFQIAKEYMELGGSLIAEEDSEGVHRAVDIPLKDIFGPANPYQTFKTGIYDYSWQLDGLPELRTAADALLGKVTTDRISIAELPDEVGLQALLGPCESQTKDDGLKNLGQWDGSTWWHYPSKGISFKLRPVESGPGQSRTVIETVVMTNKTGGDVAGIQVGDTMQKVIDRLGKGIQLSEFGREEIGARTYLGGGLAFQEEVQSGTVSRIEFRRPLSFLKSGLVPGESQDPNFARVTDIDYKRGTIQLTLKEGTSVGALYEVRNVDQLAIHHDRFNSDVLFRTESVDGHHAVCRPVRMPARTPLTLPEAVGAVRALLDPLTGFCYARRR